METVEEKTHFGYKTVDTNEKQKLVRGVFDSVAEEYDIMNNLMSLGMHHWWKQVAVFFANVREGQKVLDIAAGSGDISKLLAKKVGESGEVVVSDINASMLKVGKRKLLDAGLVDNIKFVQANAENLPFPNNYFHLATIGFGLRNVTNKDKALASMERVLRPGGKLVILEFSKPQIEALKPIYDAYSFKVLPFLGKVVANDADSYQYLAESIRMHPDQQTLQQMMQQAGFAKVGFKNLCGGIVAIHWGYKI